MATKITLRRDTKSQWESINPTLSLGEFGYESDTGRAKIGNGLDPYLDLDYFLPSLDDEFNRLDAILTNSDADEMLMYDTTEQEYVKITRRNFLKGDNVKMFATVVDIKAHTDFEENDLFFIAETETTYRCIDYVIGYTPNNKNIILIGDNEYLLLGVGGQFVLNDINIGEGSVYKINDIQVVGERQSDIANESGIAGGTYGSNEQNMMNGMKGKINDILKALRAHGLIG
jgi:hypothetical protein